MIKKLKFITLFLIFTLCINSLSLNAAIPVRIKDISHIIEARDNQLFGFGLVIGLRNTGDSKNSLFTRKALTNLLTKMDIVSDKNPYTSRNVAAVMVTGTLTPFVKKGQRISVTVSSIGDATSLIGGTLVMTQLQGADLSTYAVAQGPILVGGIEAETTRSKFISNQSTVGRIPDGAIVEAEVPVTLADEQNVTLVLNDPNFITASRVAKALEDKGFKGVRALDANTIKIPITNIESSNYVDIIAQIDAIKIIPDTSSKVVLNAKTGTVVIGEQVRLFPVAITHGNISIKISDDLADQENSLSSSVLMNNNITIEETKAKLIYLKPQPTLSSLVNALNKIGATPKDLISIIQALKESGSLIAEVEII
jgi:flagellar P-ring protein precursor FlgI